MANQCVGLDRASALLQMRSSENFGGLVKGRNYGGGIMKSYLAAATIFSFCGGFALAQQPTEPPCQNSQLAPFGISPDSHCGGTGCLVAFKNYKWWTAFTYNPSGGYYYNGDLGTTFAPETFL